MQRLENFSQVIQYLNDKEIVMLRDHTSFYIKGSRIMVNGLNTSYSLSFEEFRDLFQKETFYVYEPDNDGINSEKDDEYYLWKSMNAN